MLDREEDQNRAMAIAEPILAGLHGILSDSISFYFGDAYTAAARADHTVRAVTNCIYSHAEKRVAILAEATEGLSIIDVRSLRVANYKDQGLFRFKLVKPNGRHSNYQTKQQRNYDDQKSFPEFPEPAIRLTVGYELDEAGAGLKGIMIARPHWAIGILDGAGNRGCRCCALGGHNSGSLWIHRSDRFRC